MRPLFGVRRNKAGTALSLLGPNSSAGPATQLFFPTESVGIYIYIYTSSLGSYILTGYVSSKVRNEYRSNTGAVGGSWNVRVALHSSELNAFEILSPMS
jgi:hypothetical protein